jgi:hypothetical protein
MYNELIKGTVPRYSYLSPSHKKSPGTLTGASFTNEKILHYLDGMNTIFFTIRVSRV